MNKNEILSRLSAFPYDPKEYWLVAGAAMVLYAFREETADIDLGCSLPLADRLEADGFLYRFTPDGNRWFRFGEHIEIFENWLVDGVTTVGDLQVITPEGLIAMKERLGREKDIRDVKRIREALARQITEGQGKNESRFIGGENHDNR